MDSNTTSSKDGLESPMAPQKQTAAEIEHRRKLKIESVTTDWLLRNIIPYEPDKPWASKNKTLESKCDILLAIFDLCGGLDFEYNTKYRNPFIKGAKGKTFIIREGSQGWTDWDAYNDHDLFTGAGCIIDFIYIMDNYTPASAKCMGYSDDSYEAAVNKVKQYISRLEEEGLPQKEI